MSLHITGGAYILLAAMVLFLPIQWVGAVILAATIHELFHCIAIYLTGGQVQSVAIGGRGITITTHPMSGGKEMLCAIMGPIGSLLLLLWARWIPRTAICALVQGIYNLLPLMPFDGGRVLRGLLQCLFPPPVAGKMWTYSQRAIRIILIASCVLMISKIGILAVVFGIFLLAKRPVWRYNRCNIDKGERL